MTEETHVSKTIGQRVKELRKKIDELDGFDLAIIPFIYQWELGVKSYKFAKDKGWIDWVKNKFNGKVTQSTEPQPRTVVDLQPQLDEETD
ncbi:MAG: hypothetical protein VYE26_04315 [Pseudomonadota bacterium]|nr:hypothetical protein [Pseudomonadota bacterium]MED5270650.1 hypothetical protein [Pseudomonadota bacterium]